MKAAITTIQRNAGDYLATIASACQTEDAEFFAVLRDGDKLENDKLHGLVLTSDGVRYSQVTKMSHFRGMAFFELTMDLQSARTITVKLINA